jgi:hypothetical protein
MKLERIEGGAPVPRGYYFSLGGWEICPGSGGPLPAGEYVRLPLPAVLIVAAVMGVAFALFLPFMGFVTTGQFIARKLRRAPAARTLPAPHP